jgi:hypothetical protein
MVTKSPENPILQVLITLCKEGINWNMLSFFGRLQLFLGCGCSSRAWFFSQPCKKKIDNGAMKQPFMFKQ